MPAQDSTNFTKNCTHVEEGSYVYNFNGYFGIYQKSGQAMKKEDALKFINSKDELMLNPVPFGLPSKVSGTYVFVASGPTSEQEVTEDFLHPWEDDGDTANWVTTKYKTGRFVRSCRSYHPVHENIARIVTYIGDESNAVLSRVLYEYIVSDAKNAIIPQKKFNLSVDKVEDAMNNLFRKPLTEVFFANPSTPTPEGPYIRVGIPEEMEQVRLDYVPDMEREEDPLLNTPFEMPAFPDLLDSSSNEDIPIDFEHFLESTEDQSGSEEAMAFHELISDIQMKLKEANEERLKAREMTQQNYWNSIVIDLTNLLTKMKEKVKELADELLADTNPFLAEHNARFSALRGCKQEQIVEREAANRLRIKAEAVEGGNVESTEENTRKRLIVKEGVTNSNETPMDQTVNITDEPAPKRLRMTADSTEAGGNHVLNPLKHTAKNEPVDKNETPAADNMVAAKNEQTD